MLDPNSPSFAAAMMAVTVIGLLILTCRCLRSKPGPRLLEITAIERTVRLSASVAPAVCMVCLDDMQHGDRVAVLRCKHYFHHDCVVPWLLHNNNCPLCRLPGPVLTEV
jgi:hypothetical protein